MNCVVCGSPVPPVARAHGDPFCSRMCLEGRPKTRVSRYTPFRDLGFKARRIGGCFIAKCKCGVTLKADSLIDLEEEVFKHLSSHEDRASS